ASTFICALLVAACGGTTTPPTGTGVAATSGAPKADIKIGLATSKSGAANFYNPQQSNGALLAVEQINNAGGINGAKLQLIIEEDGSVRNQGITAIKKFMEQDKVVMIRRSTIVGRPASAATVAQATSM